MWLYESAQHLLTIDVPRGADEFPKTVVVTALRASCGCHAFIIVPAARGSIGRMAIPAPDGLQWRELAQKSAECRDTQQGGFLSEGQ